MKNYNNHVFCFIGTLIRHCDQLENDENKTYHLKNYFIANEPSTFFLSLHIRDATSGREERAVE